MQVHPVIKMFGIPIWRKDWGLYTLAFLGVHCAFMPLLVLLLPRRIETIGGGDAVEWLSWMLLGGAFIAAASFIVAGILSDQWLARFGSRRGLIAIGVAGLLIAYIQLAKAQSITSLALAVATFQISLNCSFAPLGALVTDYIPDKDKGKVSGLMSAAHPLSGGMIAFIAATFPSDGAGGFLATGLLSAALILPLIVFWPFGAYISAEPLVGTSSAASDLTMTIRRDFSLTWLARFMIQLGAAFVFNYLFFYLLSGDINAGGKDATQLIAFLAWPATFAALAACLMAGFASDRLGRRKGPIILAALTFAAGLAGLASGGSMIALVVGYTLFHAGLASFLSVETALVAQLISASKRRGAWLGIMNLTNTLPGMIAPALALLSLSPETFASNLHTVFWISAGGAIGSALAIAAVRSAR
jgi:MFS family permease